MRSLVVPPVFERKGWGWFGTTLSLCTPFPSSLPRGRETTQVLGQDTFRRGVWTEGDREDGEGDVVPEPVRREGSGVGTGTL